MYPFVGLADYYSIRKKPRRWSEFFLFLYFGTYTIEFQTWAKRFHNLHTNTLWREYPNTNIQYVYSKYDILYDTEFIAQQSYCILLPKGGHGYSVFGSTNVTNLLLAP